MFKIDGLLAEFVTETREMLDALSGELIAWEREPGNQARLDTIFRFVHTVKGSCGLFDFPRLLELSHAAEDVLDDVRAGKRSADQGLVSAMLMVIDAISDMIDAIDHTGTVPEGDDTALIAALHSTGALQSPETVPSDAKGAAQQQHRSQNTIRLPVDLLDRMMSGVSNVVLARNELAGQLREVGELAGAGSSFERMSATIAEVSEIMTRSRMQPISGLFSTLPRLVRDVSAQLGKQVNLEVDGGDVELDREMIEAIRDPLAHILRNAIDHGIETPGDRAVAGKHATGTLSISARQSGNQIMLYIVDDGKGIDADALVEKAIQAGLLTQSIAAELSTQEKLRLACLPGLSTANEVTAISGRGVGMDVVRANVERIGGTLDLDSALGAGTRITLRIPLTLMITPILMVGLRDQQFAIPRSYVEEVVQVGMSGVELDRVGNAWVLKYRGQFVPCLYLSRLMGMDDGGNTADAKILILRPSAGDVMALALESFGEHLDLAVRPVSPAIMGTGLYAGAAMTDEGNPILLLDVAGLARAGGISLDRLDEVRHSALETEDLAEQEFPEVLLFHDLRGRRRGVRLDSVLRIDEVDQKAIDTVDGRARIVLDGKIVPLFGLTVGVSDRDHVEIARLAKGGKTIAYILGEILDVKPITDAIVPEAQTGEVEGVTLIDGEITELVNIDWLLAKSEGSGLQRPQPICHLPEGDAWVNGFLRPIVEEAGYSIGSDKECADLVIVMGEPADADLLAPHLIRIAREEDAASHDPSIIQRNDRDRLLAELRRVQRGASQ